MKFTLDSEDPITHNKDLDSMVKANCARSGDLITFNSTADTLNNILTWPKPILSKKKRIQKERLPSVLTSDQWIGIMKIKEEEKKLLLEKKEEEKRNRLKKREDAKQIKLKAKKIKV